MKSTTTAESLHSHPLVKQALFEAVRTQKNLNDRNPIRVDPDYERDPDEHEFYLISVGHALAELLNLCEQVSHVAAYLSRFAQNAATKRVGITRDKHILYHIENRLIRLHSAFDRCLQLVDAVFHLTNAPAALSQSVIASNLKVKRTTVAKKLKNIRNLLGPTIDTRNDVIHHHAYKEDKLRELEMFCLAERAFASEESGPLGKPYLRSRIRELSRDLVKKKPSEFAKMNAELFAEITELLTALQPIYTREKALVEVRINAEARLIGRPGKT